jgi:restriction system protein
MAIPTYDKMLRPILQLACQQDVNRRTAAAAMEEHFKLTPDEREARIPSGSSTFVSNRSGWAMTFLTKGGLIEKVAPKTYRCTESGRNFLREHADTITVRDLEAIESWDNSWRTTKGKIPDPVISTEAQNTTTPLESLESAITTLNADLRSRLLDAILKQSPRFFEELVLDVLIAMGYGGSREDAAQHLGKSDDEGIDGRINQDPLGLDQIMVQAKRYAPDRTIDRKTLQAFIGSLAGQGVTKGIFITTSSFAESARSSCCVGPTPRWCSSTGICYWIT